MGYRHSRAKPALTALLDLMQTVPAFAYLIPLLLLFGFGPMVGLIASAIFATPPMVRNTMLGPERVPEAIREAVSRILRPVCGALQTMPQSVFLIPALMVFKVGEFTAFIAIMLYAIVPPIRYVEHGLRHVRADVVEQMGATRRKPSSMQSCRWPCRW